jgi:hypothetical protein
MRPSFSRLSDARQLAERRTQRQPGRGRTEQERETSIASVSDPAQGRVAGWSEEHLAFDIGFALPRSPIKGLRRALTEDERRGDSC